MTTTDQAKVTEDKCTRCGFVRTRADDLGLFCQSCGRPRIPFARLFAAATLALIVTYFFSELADASARRPLLILIVLVAATWSSALILRHREVAALRMVAIFVPTATVVLYPYHWGAPDNVAWPPLFATLTTIAVVISWIVLAIYVVRGLAQGFIQARSDEELGRDSFVVTILALLAIVITILYFVLPELILTAGALEPIAATLSVVNAGVETIVRFRNASLLTIGFVVLVLATISALREDHKQSARFSVIGAAGRVVVGIIRNVFKLCRDTLKRGLLILQGIASASIAIVASAGFALALYLLSEPVTELWGGREFIALEPSSWLLLGATILACVITLVVLNAVISRSLTENVRTSLSEFWQDLPRFAQAVVFYLFILSLGFLLTWVTVLAYRAGFDKGPFGGVTFVATSIFYLVLGLSYWMRDRRRNRVGTVGLADRRPRTEKRSKKKDAKTKKAAADDKKSVAV